MVKISSPYMKIVFQLGDDAGKLIIENLVEYEYCYQHYH